LKRETAVSTEPLDPEDLDELWRIERECFGEEAYSKQQLASMLGDKAAVNLIARVDGETAGFVAGVVEDFGSKLVGHVWTIDVAVKHRRKGVGMRLLRDIEAVFVSHNVEVVYLEVRADNQVARRLYETLGYREAETLEDYYSAGIHGLRMMKYLKAGSSVSS
jgi:ribosomal-protein-alanine N-acetyltransferase